MSKTLLRLWSSKGGAFVMFILYVATVAIMSLLDKTYYDLPTIAGYFVAPASLFMTVTPGTGDFIGLPTTVLLVSLLLYMILGYIIDWAYKPYD